ncbi:MAG: TetR/AcrR family transcriptional regulator [Lysobacter sp.]|nr:TetR/AcrR family transcriptional regulator [Lysobacter sp.]
MSIAKPTKSLAAAAPRKSASAPRKRTPGRPVGGAGADGTDLRRRLLQVAIERYARDGMAGASLRDIAEGAAVTPAMLHYYFGGKAALRAAVIEEVLMPVVSGLRVPLQRSEGDIGALIAGFVEAVAETAQTHPWLPQLWVREVLHADGALRGLLKDRLGPMLARAMSQRFADAQRAGHLNPRLDPRLLVPSLIGQTLFIAASAPLWREVLDAHDVDRAHLRDHTLELLRNGLELSHEA